MRTDRMSELWFSVTGDSDLKFPIFYNYDDDSVYEKLADDLYRKILNHDGYYLFTDRAGDPYRFYQDEGSFSKPELIGGGK